MRTILLLFILSISISCGSHRSKSAIILNEDIQIDGAQCPENGSCNLELIPNKSLIFKKDEFGFTYPVISEGEKTILKYTYKKTSNPNLQDANYSEIIYAEFDPTMQETTVENEELQQFNFHFGRFCFCKGETGYYPITDGKFNLKRKGRDSIRVELKFKILEVPQILNNICETISLKSN